MNGAYLASTPLRWASALRRRVANRSSQLPAASISVGNLALGGRGKTPMVAALAQEAESRGLSVVVLTRGYGGTVRSGTEPVVLQSTAPQPDIACWLSMLSDGHSSATAASFAQRCGDEPAWLASRCPQARIAIHPDRRQAAAVAHAQQQVDLFILDDGFQTSVARDLDLVLLDPHRDPPFARRAACRESAVALSAAHRVALIDADRRWDDAESALVLRRTAVALRRLSDGVHANPKAQPPVKVAAAVGQPSSVTRCARDLGLTVRGEIRIRDHGRPSRSQLKKMNRDRSELLLVTEKDAMGWASQHPELSNRTLVLEMALTGGRRLAMQVLDELHDN